MACWSEAAWKYPFKLREDLGAYLRGGARDVEGLACRNQGEGWLAGTGEKTHHADAADGVGETSERLNNLTVGSVTEDGQASPGGRCGWASSVRLIVIGRDGVCW